MFLKKLKKKSYEFFLKHCFYFIFFLKKKIFLFKDFINGGKSRESLHCGGNPKEKNIKEVK
jgi:hypothetical protein